jgi:hypothetical protein
MTSVIRSVGRWLPRRLKSAIKNRLRQLAGAAPAGPGLPPWSPVPAAPAALRPAAPPAPVTHAGPALVITSYSTDLDPAALRLLLGAIFETPVLSVPQEALLAYVSQNPGLLASREELVDGLRAYLLGQLASGTGDEEAAVACLQALAVHRRKTQDSMQAYATEGKPDPQALFWPNPTHPLHPDSVYDQLPVVRCHPFITRQTPIGSAGSCFAKEIAYRLQADGYNYVITEYHRSSVNGLSCSCARWGAIFNTPSFRQLVERAFGLRSLPKILWTRREGDRTVYLDPFREDVVFESVAEYESSYEPHQRAAREALLRTQVFIFTLGMNEVWRLRSDGAVFSRAPWGIMPDLVEPRVLTVEENLNELQRMLDVLRGHNPHVKIILSVSPVPLHATFRGADTHVMAANCHSKSVLRVTAEEFVARNRDVFYFPSYEAVMYGTPNPWEADQRHVSPEAVDKVMTLFRKTFVSPAAEEATARAA